MDFVGTVARRQYTAGPCVHLDALHSTAELHKGRGMLCILEQQGSTALSWCSDKRGADWIWEVDQKPLLKLACNWYAP